LSVAPSDAAERSSWAARERPCRARLHLPPRLRRWCSLGWSGACPPKPSWPGAHAPAKAPQAPAFL